MSNDRTTSESAAAQVARECLAVRVRLLNRVITRIYDDALRPLGVTVNQMNILAVLENLSEAQPGDLCRVLHMEKSTVSRNVERMLRHGWLSEKPGADARCVLLATTAEGRALLKKALPLWGKAQEQVRELLGEPGVEALTNLGEQFLPLPREQ
jgi:DNA-binding MarR family transcriptional regulator